MRLTHSFVHIRNSAHDFGLNKNDMNKKIVEIVLTLESYYCPHQDKYSISANKLTMVKKEEE